MDRLLNVPWITRLYEMECIRERVRSKIYNTDRRLASTTFVCCRVDGRRECSKTFSSQLTRRVSKERKQLGRINRYEVKRSETLGAKEILKKRLRLKSRQLSYGSSVSDSI